MNTRTTSSPSRRDRRTKRSKRGSVLVLAVGVLAVLAVMALSYVSVVRIDRRSTAAYQEDENLQQQVTVATAYLRSLLTADLFGGIVVNDATPRIVNNLPNFPRAFIDGEYADYPWTDVNPTSPNNTFTGVRFTFDTEFPTPSNPRPIPVPDARLELTGNGTSIPSRPYPDDAWLAALDPVDTGQAPSGEWDTWPQITNLLSAYRWVERGGFTGYARDNGLFVDLGQLLLQRPTGFTGGGQRPGNPGAFLHLDKNQSNLWTDPFTGQPNGPHLAVNQNIFDLQMSDLQEVGYWPTGAGAPADPGVGRRQFQPADERFWADTDGDGRPDARWQQLPILGNAFGKVWVIAVRITDNSAQANVNAHLHFTNNYASPDPKTIGDGRTPADIDLFRLLASQLPDAQIIDPVTGGLTPSFHPDIALGTNAADRRMRFSDPITGAGSWKFHLDEGLRIADALNQIDILNDGGNDRLRLKTPNGNFINIAEQTLSWPGDGGSGALYNGQPGSPINPLLMTRLERAAYWRYAGAFGRGALATAARPYPIRDEIDLRTYFGFNHLGVISRLEQRLDGPIPINPANGFLPGTGPDYNNTTNPGLGMLRSKEWDNLTDSPRTFNDSYALETSAGSYTNRMKLERLRKDIRRYLTTVSGSGAIGPVPVLNPADRFQQQFSTRKVDLNRFATSNFSVNADRIREPLREAYEALVWALAPFATNRAIAAPLDSIPPFTYATLARNADLHYGGGPTGPATEVAARYGLSASTGATTDDIAAAYALLRAASLAVNTADAIDAETAPGAATEENPTIVRLFNQPDLETFLDTNSGTIASTLRGEFNNFGIIPLGVRFPQGDINQDASPTITANSGLPMPDTDALPEELLGEPQNGVTLIGLDRQPFLVQAYAATFYANANAVENVLIDPADTDLDPGKPEDVLGSFFAVELGNPWPEPLELAGYSVRIDNGANFLSIDFDTATLAGGAIINPGRAVTFYFFSDVSPELLAAAPNAQTEWDVLQSDILDTFGGAGAEVREILPSTDPGVSTIDGPTDLIQLFRDFGADPKLPVLLIKTIRGGTGGTSTPLELLVDRLSPKPTAFFPNTLGSAINLELNVPVNPFFTGARVLAGRAAVYASVRRPDEAGNGFPSYVVERPEENIGDSAQGADIFHGWNVNDLAGSPPVLAEDLADQLDSRSEITFLEPDNQDGSLPLPPFELFVPNTPLVSTAELGLISTFTHMYVHTSSAVAPDIATAWDTAAPLGAGKWVTISEQLGWDEHISYNSQSAVSLTNQNPYLGVLDFSRFIPGGDLDAPSGRLPDTLAVPLATRVFDAFEAIPTPDATGLVRGRVNINTAPRRVLELLPLVDPRDPFNPLSPVNIAGVSFPTLAAGATRLDWIDRYRKRHPTPPGPTLPSSATQDDAFPQNEPIARSVLQTYTTSLGLTGLPGMRIPQGTDAPWSLGVANLGELAVMGQWGDNADIPRAEDAGFLELGVSTISPAHPFDLRNIATTGFEASNDPEDRLAFFRALANIVSTRSDIFTAWYILRAYDPLDIESISIDPNLDDEQIIDLMNPGSPFALDPTEHRGLLPTFERRMLVIFDRSNVRSPTDRPRVLLQVELPLN